MSGPDDIVASIRRGEALANLAKELQGLPPQAIAYFDEAVVDLARYYDARVMPTLFPDTPVQERPAARHVILGALIDAGMLDPKNPLGP